MRVALDSFRVAAGGVRSCRCLRIAKTVLASSPQIETTLHVVNFVTVRLECWAIAKRCWPEVGIAWMNNVPANTSLAYTVLQVRKVCRLLEIFQSP